MELWVRSQDKTILSKAQNIIIRENQNENNEINYAIVDIYTMGIYKTKERALEVLDEIQNLLKPKAYIKSNMKLSQKNIKELADAYKEVFDDKVLIVNDDIDIQSLGFITYEMPKE